MSSSLPRSLLLALALAPLAPMLVAAPDAAASPRGPVRIEPGLQAADDVGPSLTPAVLRPREAAGPDEPISFIVRLAGPTVLDVYKADLEQAQAAGLEPMGSSSLQATHDTFERRQRPARHAIEGTGAVVIDSFQTVLNGFLVHATRDQIADIANVRGVVSVARAPILELDLLHSVPWIGAERVKQELGIDGTGATVAVIDTGIDYTHMSFGGAGTVEAYDANDPNVIEDGTFPTAKVIGGYDLAGLRYSAGCPANPQPPLDCHREPRPDDDPLDGSGHGSHVAGIVAGHEIPNVHAGAAPGAKLVALKVFGTPVGVGASTDLASSAIEWATDSNLGLDVAGCDECGGVDDIGKIDVINMSLGSSWGGGMVEANLISAAATDAGITVVASAGNSGDIPYVTGSPAVAETTVSVASSFSGGLLRQAVSAEWMEGGQLTELVTDAVTHNGWAGSLVDMIKAQSAYYGLACDDLPNEPEQDVTEQIALIQRGDCTFYDKIWNAQRAGAIAAVLITDDREKTTMGCGAPSDCNNGPEIPAFMIDNLEGWQLRDLLRATTAVTITLDPDATVDTTDKLGDTISGFSSRGPGRSSAGIKPQITAPGSGIVSTGRGSGDGSATMGGTSMAAPTIAGVAALMWQRNYDHGLGLDALGVGALMMNYANPTIKSARHDIGPSVGVPRQGAGRVDAYHGATGMTVLRSESGVAELSFGNINVEGDQEAYSQTLEVYNMSGEAKIYAADSQFVFDEDEGKGVSLAFEPNPLTVPGGETSELTVTLNATREEIRPWELRGPDAAAVENMVDPNATETPVERLSRFEIDGFVNLTEVDASGDPVEGGDVAGVPFLTLPHRRSCIRSTTPGRFSFNEPGESINHSWENTCGEDGEIEIYALAGSDPVEPSIPGNVNIGDIGVRWGINDPDTDPTMLLQWKIQLGGPKRLPLESEPHIYLDLDQDGTMDRVAVALPWGAVGLPVGTYFVSHAPLITGTLNFSLASLVTNGYLLEYDIDEGAITMVVNAGPEPDGLGLDEALLEGTARFNFGVSLGDVLEDYPTSSAYPGYDYAPDGLEEGRYYTFDQSVIECFMPDGEGTETDQARQIPGAGESDEINISMACEPPDPGVDVGLMFGYPTNSPGAQTETRRGRLGPYAVYVPTVSRNHELYPAVSMELAAQGDRGQSGEATLTEKGGGLKVSLELVGENAGDTINAADGNHPAHIHSGSCAEAGPIAHLLSHVVNGTSSTSLSGLSLADVADGNHAIKVHMSDGNLDEIISCGNIPQRE